MSKEKKKQELTIVKEPFKLVRPKKYTSPMVMKRKIEDYFKKADASDRRYSVEGLTLHLGFSSVRSLLNYEKEEGYEKYHDLIAMAKLKIQEQRIELLQEGKMNPIAAIFLLTNNSSEHYKHKKEVEYNHSGTVLHGFKMIKQNDSGNKTIEDTGESMG